MKITKNFIDGQVEFQDLREGTVFIADQMTFMKIHEFVSEERYTVNAVYMEDGDTACFDWNTKVKPVKNAELIIEVEN